MNTFIKLAEGSTSSAYLYENDNKKFVMCVPSPKNKHMSQWLRHARRYVTVSQSISRKLKAEYAVARLIRNGNSWEIHTNYVGGEGVSIAFFNSLLFDTQEKILTDLAELYLSLHELSINHTDERYTTQIMGKNNKLYLYAGMFRHFIAKYKKTYLSVSQKFEKRKLRQDITKIKKRILENPIVVKEYDKIEKILDKIIIHPDAFKYYGAYHSDIHVSNLFFNKKTQKIGVIDFGGSTYRKNIYLELGYLAVPSSFGLSFVSRLAVKINKLSSDDSYHWKKQLHINLDLLKSFTAYAMLKSTKKLEQTINQIVDENF